METILNSFRQGWQSIPPWLQVLPLLFGGWLMAWLLRLLVAGLFRLIRFDRACERTGFNEFLRKGRVGYTPSKLVAAVIFWIALGSVFVAVAQRLDVEFVRVLSARWGEVIPALIVATLMGILGIAAVIFVANFVMTVARNAGFAHADLLARIIKWVGVILVCLLAFEQVSFGKTLLAPLVEILFGAVALGAALAFGLGCKDLARDAVLRVLASLRERRQPGPKSDLED